MGVLEAIAMTAGITGVISSIFTLIFKRKSEYSAIQKLSKRAAEINLKLIELEKAALELNEQKLRAEELQQEVQDYKVKIYKKQLEQFQELLKKDILEDIDDESKSILIENLEQKYLSGRLDYMNKLLDKIGTNKTIELIQPKKSASS